MKKPVIDTSSLNILKERKEALRSTESFPYSEELSEVMIKDVVTCAPMEIVNTVVKRMVGKKITSSIVINTKGKLIGILTEGDIMRRIVSVDGVTSMSARVEEVMTKNPVSLSPEDSIYRALSVLSVKGVKHLPLVREGRPVGLVTLRQLLKLRYPEPMTIVESISRACDASDLKAAKEGVSDLAARKLSIGVRAFDIVTMVSLINQDIHRRAFELALEKLGDPPSGCCLFLTGSHGRRENLLVTDQDHGMIIADTSDGITQYSEYYMELTNDFSHMLIDIGFSWCPGYIMSVNPTWRKSLSEWKIQIRYWLNAQVANLTRFLTVLFDSIPIYGETHLFNEMMDFAFSELSKHHEALRILHEEEGHHKVPTGLLGRFITERSGPHRGQLDIKKSGLIFMVEAVRILALQHGIRATSTLKRIEELVKGGVIHSDDGEYFEASYRLLLSFALNAQVEKHLSGKPIDTYISPDKLSPREKDVLRRAFKSTTMLKGFIASEFGELVL
jgi:CBS domain-containing protein